MERRRPTVAIVDDDGAVRVALGRLLRGAGFDVVTYVSGEDYLARDGVQPDCLLLDIHLGGMTGLELREELARAGSLVPVIFITAHDDAATQQGLRGVPGVPCLRKPFDETILFEAIEKVRSAPP